MSRLRRLVVSDRWFFITCRLLPGRRILSEAEFACLARVIHERRVEHGFSLTAWVFLPDHWHAIFYPAFPLAISRVMEAIKDGASKRINRARCEVGNSFVRGRRDVMGGSRRRRCHIIPHQGDAITGRDGSQAAGDVRYGDSD